MPPRTNPQLRLNLPRNPRRKIRRRGIVHRNNSYPAQNTSKERRNPLRAVFAPQHHPIALMDLPRLKLPAKANRQLQDLPVGKPLHAVPATLAVSALLPVRPEICEEKFC
jgi:hypothetical protein